MQVLTASDSKAELSRALGMMLVALEILDEIDAPADVGSHLDLAISRLERALGMGQRAKTSVQDLISQLENELAAASLGTGAAANPWELKPK